MLIWLYYSYNTVGYMTRLHSACINTSGQSHLPALSKYISALTCVSFPFEFFSVLFFAAYKMQLGFDPSTESIWRWGWKCRCGQLLWNSGWYLLQQHRTSGPAWHWLIIYRGSWPWMLTVSIPLSKVQLVFTVQKTPWPNYCSCRAGTKQTLQ